MPPVFGPGASGQPYTHRQPPARLEAVPDSTPCRIASLTLLKARRLALGIYALILHSLGQEAGALFRPLQEAWEFLRYLRVDPTRAREVIDGRVPRAGEVGKRVGGRFKEMRQYLNEHASHLAFTFDSMGHLVDLDRLSLRISQTASAPVIRRNMGALFGVFYMSVGEALLILALDDFEAFDRFAERFDGLKGRAATLFRVERPADTADH